MKTPVFTGSAVAIVTPFTNDTIDFTTLSKLLDFQIESGTDAIVVCGTTGEASTQTDQEHLATIRHCVEYVNGRVPIIAGTGSNDTAHGLALSQAAEKIGADALLLVTPYYNKTTQHGLVKHFTYIADHVNIPIILYNVPSRTGLCFSAKSYLALSRHPNINGIKEASGDMDLLTQTLSLCGDEMNIWSGNDDIVVPLMAMGGKGVISVLANIMPAEMAQMTHLMLEGKTAQAANMQIRLYDLISALFIETNPVPVKTAMNLMGMDIGGFRMPLCDMLSENRETLKKAMLDAGLEIIG